MSSLVSPSASSLFLSSPDLSVPSSESEIFLSHSGELAMRSLMNIPSELSASMSEWPTDSLPAQHQAFYSSLPYFTVASLDTQLRPWASILVQETDLHALSQSESEAHTQTAGQQLHKLVQVNSQKSLTLTTPLTTWSPWLQHNIPEWKPNSIAVSNSPTVVETKPFPSSDSCPADLKLHTVCEDESQSDARVLQRYVAGVGIMFHNRRRNKVMGKIIDRTILPAEKATLDQPALLKVTIQSTEAMGNCPKYITVRHNLTFFRRSPRVHQDRTSFPSLHSTPLSESAHQLLDQADVSFLATRHRAAPHLGRGSSFHSMDCNIRGGAPGFIRTSKDRRTVYLPDYSGNRIYSSLGNIVSDGVAGLTVPNFVTGDVLYLTGDAQVLIGQQAQEIMPMTQVLIAIRVVEWTYLPNSLNLIAHENNHQSPQFSPYNPPVRVLREEMTSNHHVASALENLDTVSQSVQIISSRALTSTMQVFTIQLSKPIMFLPGMFAVFDLSTEKRYQHMSEQDPQLLNDPFIRTWTISSAMPIWQEEKNTDQKTRGQTSNSTPTSTDHGMPNAAAAATSLSSQYRQTHKIQITVKHKPGGRISSLLFARAKQSDLQSLKLRLMNVGGEFTCFQSDNASHPSLPTGSVIDFSSSSPSSETSPLYVPLSLKYSDMTWICAGSGVTPFMSMWSSLLAFDEQALKQVNIHLFFSGRTEEIQMAEQYFRGIHHLHLFHTQSGRSDSLSPSPQPSLSNTASASSSSSASIDRYSRRLSEADIQKHHSATSAQMVYFVCGPDGFAKDTIAWLGALNVPTEKIITESFSF